MEQTVYDRYLEAEVLSADPMKLVWLLSRGAMDAVRAAGRHLQQGDIRGRSREISRAWGILQELAGSLDHLHGGEISGRLAGLYAYMQSRLIEANVEQSGGPLEEVERLLAPLVEAWQAVQLASEGAEPGWEGGREAVALAPR
jgi:flagellar protein FliS